MSMPRVDKGTVIVTGVLATVASLFSMYVLISGLPPVDFDENGEPVSIFRSAISRILPTKQTDWITLSEYEASLSTFDPRITEDMLFLIDEETVSQAQEALDNGIPVGYWDNTNPNEPVPVWLTPELAGDINIDGNPTLACQRIAQTNPPAESTWAVEYVNGTGN